MRKLLTTLLAVLMLLSCVTVAAHAEETPERMILSEFDLATGWGGILQLEGGIDGGDSCIAKTLDADIEGTGGFKAEFKPAQTYDISNMQYIAFDLYVSSAQIFNAAPLCIELSSAGTCDHQEIAVTSAAGGVMAGLKDGWNEVKINIEALTSKTSGANADIAGDFDSTRWNYFRMFNVAPLKVGDGLTVAIDNFGFAAADPNAGGETSEDTSALDAEEMTATDTSIPLFGCNSAWGSFIIDKENKVAGSASLSYIMSAPMTARKVLSSPVNATGMDTLEMDLYFSDLDIMNIDFDEATFEMSSSGVPDGAELYIFFADLFEAIISPKVGWNHVAVPIAQLAKADVAKKGDFDISNINHIGIYWTKCETNKIGMTFKIDNIRLTSGAAELEKQNEAAVEAVLEMIGEIKNLKASDITEDNYKELKHKVEAARAAYDALSTAGRDAANGKAAANNLQKAERAIQSYERDLEQAQKPEQPAEPIEPDKEPEEETHEPEPDPDTTGPDPDASADSDTKGNDNGGNDTMTLIYIIIGGTVAVVAVIAVVCVVVIKKRK